MHITQKPVALMRELVTLVPPGGVVLDPFAGSGSTGLGALAEDRRVVLFDIGESNAAITRERLRAEENNTTLAAARAGQVPLFGASE